MSSSLPYASATAEAPVLCSGPSRTPDEGPVQILWTFGGYPVEKLSAENYFRRPAERIERTVECADGFAPTFA
jgi:hypothetical protein